MSATWEGSSFRTLILYPPRLRISLLIPTWRRPDALRRCLDALANQSRVPEQVVLVVRSDDEATHAMLASCDSPIPLEVIEPPRVGVVAALNAGLDAATGDVVVITDDDSEALPDWLARIEAHFLSDGTLAGVCGRDRIVASAERATSPATLPIGRVLWFGRVVGNHHLGAGQPRDVDIMKGVNMSIRRSALGRRRIDTELRGEAVEQNWEIDLCLALRQEGWRLLYDPAVEVLHHEEPRPVGEREQEMSDRERYDAVYNQTRALARHLRSLRRLVALAYAFLVGTRDNPGPLLALEIAAGGTPWRDAVAHMKVATAARVAAVRRSQR